MFVLKWVKTKTSNRESELAFGVLMLMIINVFLAIAIVAIQTREEMCQYEPTRVFLKQEITELWFASLKIIASKDILIGSAAVISKKWVLTSASCIEESQKWPKSKKILVDSYEESHNVTRIVRHKNTDLGLLKVDIPFYPEQLITYGLKKATDIKDTTLIAYSKNQMDKNDNYEVLKINVMMDATKNCTKLGNLKNQAFFCGICSSNNSMLMDLGPGGFLLRDKYLIGMAISKSTVAKPCVFLNITSFTSWIFNNTLD